MKKKNILILLHTWIDYDNQKRTSIGGTTLHVMDIIKGIEKDYNCFILATYAEKYILVSYINGEFQHYDIGVYYESMSFDRHDSKYKELLKKLLKILDIDLVHIHHLMGHTYDVIDVLEENKIETIVTIHDYFMICPQINLLYQGEKYCNRNKNEKCNNCIQNQEFNFNERNEVVNRILNHSKANIIPNISIETEFKKIFNEAKFTLIEHGLDVSIYDKKIEKNGKFNVAFVGVMNNIKGSKFIKEIINSTKDVNIKYHFFGISTDRFFLKNKKNYINHGEYNRKNIGKKLNDNNIDLVCLLTICPETFCYTLSEVISTRTPILGFNIGAIGERISRLKCGWTIDINSSNEDIIKYIIKIKNNEQEYDECLARLNKIYTSTINDMINDILKIYKKNIKNNKKISQDYSKVIFNEIENAKNLNDIDLKVKRIFAKVYRFTKNLVPYSLKRPVYLLFKKVRKR